MFMIGRAIPLDEVRKVPSSREQLNRMPAGARYDVRGIGYEAAARRDRDRRPGSDASRKRAEDLSATRQTTPYHRAHIDHTASASPHGWQRFYRPPAIPNRRRETSCRLVSC